MATEDQPQWQIELLWLESWTQHEFLSVLCGGDPDGPDERDAEYQRAQRHVDRAISAGELTVEYFRAATEDEPSGDYHVGRDEAIRWATEFQGRFPHFPFTLDDPPSVGTQDLLDTRVFSHLTAAEGSLPPALAGADTPELGSDRERLAGSAAPDARANVFRRVGAGWEIRFNGKRLARLPHLEGFELIRTLLENPGVSIGAAQLMSGMGVAKDVNDRAKDFDARDDVQYVPSGLEQPVFDDVARLEYKKRLREIDDQLEITRETDPSRASELEEERLSINEELRVNTGLGGRTRRLGSDLERVRKAAGERYARALQRLRDVLPELAEHLSAAVTAGRSYAYNPSAEVSWETRSSSNHISPHTPKQP